MFQYIASSDEYGTRAIFNKHGYDVVGVNNAEDMGVAMVDLIENVGEEAWNDFLALHPDKNVIVDRFATSPAVPLKTSCGCDGHKKQKKAMLMPNKISESHIFIFAGALLLAAAIIAKN